MTFNSGNGEGAARPNRFDLAMTADPDPFVHLPSLKGRIVDPAASQFRLSGPGVEKWDEMARRGGYPENWRHTDEHRHATRKTALDGRTGSDIWVFAYGSLMWDPAFFFEEIRCATLPGLHRSFCLRIELGRGSPSSPSLMAALDKGGECHGLAFRIARERIETETDMIWRREMVTDGYRAEFLDVATPQGQIEALSFVADPTSAKYVGRLPEDEAAAVIATGSGVLGTNLEYLDGLARRLRDLDIVDPGFFALHERARTLAGT